ncbi:MAG: hypothetical protein CM1200mP27_06180 [Chloroflexota bacterium]|nr:MAG: hypothetical protein CM1200mP27_06180 [Chloroflexota bacterium]
MFIVMRSSPGRGNLKSPTSLSVPITVSAGLFTLAKVEFLKKSVFEQHSKHRGNVVVGSEVFVFQHLDGFNVLRRSVLPCGNLYIVCNEEVVEVAGHEPCGGGLLHYDVHNVFAVEIPRLAKECLFFIVVVSGVVHEGSFVLAVGIARD